MLIFRLYSMINMLKEQVEEARDAINWNNWEHAIQLLTELLEVSTALTD